MAPRKRDDVNRMELTRARMSRDMILRSIRKLAALAAEVVEDSSKRPNFEVRYESLDASVAKFEREQEIVLSTLIELGEEQRFEVEDADSVDIMETLCGDIRTVAAGLSSKPTNIHSSGSQNTRMAAQSIALPKIEIPRFDGDVTVWCSFRDTYQSLIHNNSSITDIERFHYLLSSLSGPALAVAKMIPLSADNYSIIWNALKERYDNQRLLATAHIDKLFSFVPLTKESVSSLSAFVNTFRENVSAVRSLGVDDLAGFLLFYIAVRVIDPVTRRLFEANIPQNEVPNLETLVKFVSQRCKILENVGCQIHSKSPETLSTAKSKNERFKKTSLAVVTPTRTETCAVCSHEHPVHRCFAFKRKSVSLRRDLVVKNKLCFICLKSGHMVKTCTAPYTCKLCTGRHNTLLHPNATSSEQTNSALIGTQVADNEASMCSPKFAGTTCTNTTVLLGTAMIRVTDGTGTMHSVRALLDSGSQVSAITSDCVTRLGLSRRKSRTEVVGLSQQAVIHLKGITSFNFCSRHAENPEFSAVNVVILSRITSPMPNTVLNPDVRTRYHHLTLADPEFDIPAKVEVLIGGDLYPLVMRSRTDVVHSMGMPSAMNTHLGWIIFGTLQDSTTTPLTSLVVSSTPPIDEVMRCSWSVEEPGEVSTPITQEQQCDQWFQQSVKRDDTGRFHVGLPFKSNIRQSAEREGVPGAPVKVTEVVGLGPSIVLSWLNAEQRLFKIFVTNRVAKIKSLLPQCVWAHVHTRENPADPASRGLLPRDLTSCSLFFQGPRFLYLPVDQWPSVALSEVKCDQLPEAKQSKKYVLLLQEDDSFLKRFSALFRMQRVLAYCLRFINKCRLLPCNNGPISWREYKNTLNLAVKYTQRMYFSYLYKSLADPILVVKPNALAQFAPFVDPQNIIRVGGRLKFSTLEEEAKHPILLPKESHLSLLIIRHYHLNFLHGGPRLILSMIQRRFWILSGRDAVRKFIFSCVKCTRFRASCPQPFMADLPFTRVQQHRPFTHIGMDYGGPFIVKEGRRRNSKTSKAYLALFICMTTKAVHLEVVSDLSTDAFLAALDRFVARRGIPSLIQSDCGTNFVGAARQLKMLFANEDVQGVLQSHVPCQWKFNPPAAPHFGGIWEAAIKSAKLHLKKVIGIQTLTMEELTTLVVRVEGVLNSRPVLPVSNDPNDLSALTPGHFLIGQPILTVPEPDFIDRPINRLTRWQLIKQAHQRFWTRWSREYLQTLQGRQKWYVRNPSLAVGDMVVINSPIRPPMAWQMGRITEVHPGPDGVIRVATVKTTDGILKRPAVKLVKLPTSE